MKPVGEKSPGMAGAWLSRCAIVGAPLLAILLQLQATLPFGENGVRMNAADAALVLGAPLLLVGGVIFYRELYRLTGARLIAAILLATAVLTVALLTGRAVIGHVTGWAGVKYAGWYGLLAYLVAGALMMLVWNRADLRRFSCAFLGFQAVIVILFLATILLSIDTPLNYGPRLIGFAGNPNVMGLYLLCGLSLCFAFLGSAAAGAQRMKVLFVGAALLFAGVLFTRSVAAFFALPVLCGMTLAFRTLAWRRLLGVVLLASCIWALPQVANPARNPAVNVVSKAISMVRPQSNQTEKDAPPGEQRQRRILSIMKEQTLDARLGSYRQALKEWRGNPLLGAGLGVHLHDQGAVGKDKPLVQIHSTPLWLLAETGLLGLGAMLALYLLVFVRIARSSRAPDGANSEAAAFATGVLLLLVAWAVMAQFHELLYQRALWLLTGMALAMSSPRTAFLHGGSSVKGA